MGNDNNTSRLTEIDEYEEIKGGEKYSYQQEAYIYDKNEKMPKKKDKKFQAHTNEGICIQHSPDGSCLITAGDN